MMIKRIHVIKKDITRLEVDAIVNAANRTLLGGGGVDGAIHRAAGPQLLDECRSLNGCETGQAKLTGGYNLPAKFVIHAVGPVWRGGNNNESLLLESAYQHSLSLAQEKGCNSVAFPNISTGIYGYPKEEAAHIAVRTVRQFLNQNSSPKEVIFCCFDDENFSIYQQLLKESD
jgi:O-acetyl-ADP-ribose deacetylase